MSYTYPSRPSVSRTTRGAGVAGRRGGRTAPVVAAGRGAGPAVEPTQAQGPEVAGATQPEGRIETRGAYTVIAPNEKKRAAIAQQAKKEEESYAKYKQERKLGFVSYTGTVGGGMVAENTARKLQQAEQSPVRKRMQVEERRQQERRRREHEDQHKKDMARRKAEENVGRDDRRSERLDEDRRRVNEAWLKRMEEACRSSK